MTTSTARKRFTPEAARARRAKSQATFEYELSNTLDEDGNPYVIEARIPDMTDLSAYANLPKPLQAAMFKMMNDVDGAGGTDAAIDPDDLERNRQIVARGADIIEFYLVAGFVDPRCYSTAEEADEQGGIWYQDIDSMDRIAFMAHCSGRTEELAKKLIPFRERPDGGLHGGPAGEAVSADGEASEDQRPARASRKQRSA